MRLHRLIAILLFLESRGQVKAKELAAALETSERTIYRDIDILCESGVPITAITGPSGGFSLMEGYTAGMNQLRGDDIISLFLCGIGLRPNEQSEAELRLKNTLAKLEAGLPPEYKTDIQTARNRFYFDPGDWWNEKRPLSHMDGIRHAVWHSQKIRIHYTKNNEEPVSRTVRPYGLVVKYHEWYLVAFCEMRYGIRSFKCERISSLELLEDFFTIPADFHLESFWRENVHGFQKTTRAREYYPVRIEWLNRDRLGLPDWMKIEVSGQSGRMTETVNLLSLEYAQEKLFPHLDSVKVLAPKELCESLNKKLQAAITLNAVN